MNSRLETKKRQISILLITAADYFGLVPIELSYYWKTPEAPATIRYGVKRRS